HRPYAVCAFVGGWAYVGLWQAGAPGWVALVACVGVTAGLRALSLWRDWQLPAWRHEYTSHPLDHEGDALPHTDAHGAQRVAPARGVQPVARRRRQPRPRGPQRVPQRDRTTPGIDPLVIILEPQQPQHRQPLRRERLVQLDHV